VEQRKGTIEFEDNPDVPEGNFMLDEREKLVRKSARWLAGDTSAVVGTLRIETRVPIEFAEEVFDQWLRELQARNCGRIEWRGGPRLRMRANISFFQVLIKGLGSTSMERARVLWREFAGRASLHQIYPEWIGLPAEQPQDEY